MTSLAGLGETDRALLFDLLAAAHGCGVEPCLIGAAALQLALRRSEVAPLPRTTRDWDFAVAIGSWQGFEQLAAALVGSAGRFRHAVEPHRFTHRGGATLDIVPYGTLESPPGTIRWPDGGAMSTVGFAVLSRERELHELGGGVRIHSASLTALAGLKLIAYGDRRPAVLRDIGDLLHIAKVHPWSATIAAIDPEAERALKAGDVSIADLGAFVLGLRMAAAFDDVALDLMRRLLVEANDPYADLIEHALRQTPGPIDDRDREVICNCVQALARGLGR